MDATAIQISAAALFRDEQFIARGVVDDARDHGSVFIGGKAGGAMFEAHGNAKYRVAMGEIRCAVERVDVPAIFVVDAVASSLFAVDAVAGKVLVEALDDEAFAGAVGLGDEVYFTFVFGGDRAVVELANECAGLDCNLSCEAD